MSAYDVHPVADLFPMLADDELQELAEDIEQRGLLQPIVLDAEGRVLDGRNRLAACQLVGVEPTFETYSGDDPEGYAFTVNVARRHLRAGARYLLTEKARRLVGSTKIGISDGHGMQNRLAEAGLVLDFAPDHVEKVMTGTESLQTAVGVARERKKEQAETNGKKERLRKAAPDLLDQVADGRLDLDEALGALEVREQRARQEEAERRAREREELAIAERLAALPADLVERVTAGSMDIAEAESVRQQRAERLAVWAEKIRTGLETFARMVGNPVPAELKEHLAGDDIDKLDAILGALENGERE